MTYDFGTFGFAEPILRPFAEFCPNPFYDNVSGFLSIIGLVFILLEKLLTIVLARNLHLGYDGRKPELDAS